VLCPFRQSDLGREVALPRARAEDHQVIWGQLHAIERRVIVLDDLADVQPEFLQRGVASSLFLKLGEADLPLWLTSAALAADLIQAALQWATQAEIVV